MDVKTLAAGITPELYERLRTAVEIGKWPDGTVLTDEQRANSMQLVMAYQAVVLKSEEHMSVGADGQLVTKSKAELKRELNPDTLITKIPLQ